MFIGGARQYKMYNCTIDVKQGDLANTDFDYDAVVNSIGVDYGFGGQIAKALA